MIALLLALGTALGAPCRLEVVHAPEASPLAIAVAWPTAAGDAWLPAGSLVLAGGACEGGVRARVVALDGWVRRSDPAATYAAPGEEGCVPAPWLVPAGDRPLEADRALPDRPAPPAGAPPAGTRLAPAAATQACAGPLVLTDGHRLPLADATALRAPSAAERAAAAEVRAAYVAAFGPPPAGGLFPTSPWGYAGLPLVHLRTAAEIREEWAREDLQTPEQREKAVTDLGPERPDGVPYYAHFLGRDVRFTDQWARPATIAALLGLIRAWSDHCTGTLARSPAVCTVQIGDLAFYDGLRPDPLGHADHYEGTCADIRLFRSDGARYEAWWNRPDDRPGHPSAYDEGLTRAFLAFASSRSDVSAAYFDDPAVYGSVPGVHPVRGHDDHMHLCFDVHAGGAGG